MAAKSDWAAEVVSRYRQREPRSRILHDLMLADLPGDGPYTMIDVGCGKGLDGEPALQRSLAAKGALIGVEPDAEVQPDACLHAVHRRLFEQADIEPSSADLIYCTFVLEHVRDPDAFWSKAYDSLRPGGVFWALTVDSRSPFALLSHLAGALRIKERYLDKLHGDRGEERYETYPTYYRANSPKAIRKHAAQFSDHRFLGLYRRHQMDFYVPRFVRPAMWFVDHFIMTFRLPGSVLLMRLQK